MTRTARKPVPPVTRTRGVSDMLQNCVGRTAELVSDLFVFGGRHDDRPTCEERGRAESEFQAPTNDT